MTASSGARTITYSRAITEALDEEMARDERVVVLGEDVGRMGGIFGATPGLYEKYGADRVIDTPISEMFIVGGAVGLAITGLRPVAELQFADFIVNAADETLSKMSKWRYMHGGQFRVPMVLRMPEGATGGGGAEHSLCPEALMLSYPGAHIVVPSTPADAKGLLKAAIRDDNPVGFFEHKALYATRGAVPDDPDFVVPIGKADIKREGTDVTVIAWGRAVHWALAAADLAATDGTSVEVLDTRGLRPLDTDAIFASIEKTGRVVIAQEAPRTGGGASEISAVIAENVIDLLEGPIKRIGAMDVPIPQNPALEALVMPTPADIHLAVKELVG
ncbi:alpha-ketoacid dehydrogenase subunit beta [Nakamurella leprariae]|uniref:Alpha-ketoacid dehydrogenase subunit beta n=1 Tax=Nakamurella leprariae TaxID=2803911 RepID=A0A938YJK5_9ACTN|nr:alpha-ketoacid dehydrogenase subunit beta [Nakamurella leprariae]MBM9469053.1 alpha-ketoacid dehydrogenase subunit beta [Nakamurella leprariae]